MTFLGEPLPSVDEVTLRELLQNLDHGVALVTADDWQILFENAQFFRWFPPGTADVETLVDRVGDLNTERAASRVEAGRAYSFETKSRQEGLDEPLRVSVSTFSGLAQPCYLVQVRSAAKEMEIQYMLDSYSSLAEKP